MSHWLAALVQVCRVEAIMLLRTREIYTAGVLPAVLLLPASALLVALLLPWVTPSELVVAVPEIRPDLLLVADDDAPPSLRSALRLVPHPDPAAAFAAGEVDAAVLRWGPGQRAWVDITAVAHRRLDQVALEGQLNHLVSANLEAQIPGGAAAAFVAWVADGPDHRLQTATSGGTDARQSAWALLVLVVVVLGMMAIPARAASERLDGTLEALAITTSGTLPVFVVRVMGTTALFCALVAVPVLLMGVLVPVASLLEPSWLAIVETGLTVALANSVLLVVGLASRSVRAALQWAGTGPMLVTPALSAGFLQDLPWVPVAGFLEPGPAAATAVRLLGTAALVAVALGVAAWLGHGPRALPLGERDE